MMVKADVTEPLIYAGILAILLGYRAFRALGRRPRKKTAESAATR
jgi:DMSO/TMAO reductase YedYZ heme-binding membrane subunit